jgi:ABC-type glycerol-3-phosphate transport system substrate-binding protein
MRFLAATAAAIALLALAAGCGGGGGDGSSSSGGGTDAGASGDPAAAANEACAAANRKIAALSTPENEVAVLEYLEQTEEAVEQLQVEVAGVDGSDGIAEYSEALASAVAVLNEMSNAARSRNPDGVRELSKELEKLHVGKVAAAAGLETCSEAPGVES